MKSASVSSNVLSVFRILFACVFLRFVCGISRCFFIVAVDTVAAPAAIIKASNVFTLFTSLFDIMTVIEV